MKSWSSADYKICVVDNEVVILSLYIYADNTAFITK